MAALAGRQPARRHRSWSSPPRPARRTTSPRRSACLLPPDRVATFPSWETLPHERLSPRSDTVGRRLAVLRRLAHPDPDDPAYGPLSVVVAPVRRRPPAGGPRAGRAGAGRAAAGDEAPLEDVVDALAAAAYTRTDLVERRGEFAVRGGILDVFPPTEEHPVRVEFWGDTVEEIRWFKVADQRSLEIAQHGLWAPPCRELLLTDAVRERARRAGRRAARRRPTCWPSSPRASPSRAWSRSCPSCSRIRRHAVGPRPAARRVRSSCWSTPSASAPGPTTSSRRAPSSSRPAGSDAAAGSAVPVDLQGVLGTASFWTLAELREHARVARPAVVDADLVRQRRRAGRVIDRRRRRRRAGRPRRPPTSSRSAATPRRRSRSCGTGSRDGWRVVVVTEGHGLARRVHEVLGEHDVAADARPSGRGHRDRPRPRDDRLARPRLRRRTAAARRRDRGRPHRAARQQRHQGHAPDAVAAAQPGRPAPAAARRPRRPRAARCRPVRRDGPAHRPERDPRVPRHRVRVVEAGPAGRPALRARPTSWTR